MTALKKWLTLVAVAAVSWSLSGQNLSIDPSDISVDVDFVKAPNFQVSKGYSTLPISSDSVKWFRILVTYVPRSEKTGKNQSVWEPDLLLEANVIIPADSRKGYGNAVYLSGKQQFYSVSADGKKHYALFLVPPNIFTQYSSMDRFIRAEAETIPVAVVFKKGTSQSLIATGYYVPKGKSERDIAKLFSAYYNAKLGVLKLDGAVLPKESTPWQWIDTDIFDLPKSIMEGRK